MTEHRRESDRDDHAHERIDDMNDELLQCKTEVGREIEGLKKQLDKYITRVEHLLSIFEAAEGFFKVLGWIGVAVKWLAAIIAAIGAIWFSIKHGGN